MSSPEELLSAAERLHRYLLGRHCAYGLLHGPDPGVRFNLRAWRFLKSALDFLPWRDDYDFMQSQGYWVLANWKLYEATGEGRFRFLALETSESVLKLQTPQGFWRYPLPERKHLIATTEGNWGAMALLESHGREARQEFLSGAIRWYDYLAKYIGFQEHGRGKAANYFDRPRGKVPNNSVGALWLFLKLWKATGDRRFIEHVDALLEFIAGAQLPSGELPYVVESPYERRREHYLCFQYNAFEFLELARVAAIAPDSRAASILPPLARFLEKGVTASGGCAADCFRARPEIDYHTAVLGAALQEAARRGLVASFEASKRCFARVLSHQKRDGSFAFSRGDYGFLRDGRSYPRQQAMTLVHLLCGAEGQLR